jgi:hypothetical protein
MLLMTPMKPALFLLLLSASLLAAVQASAKTVLPDSCGDDSVKFDVKTQKDQPAPAGPAEGKAQVILVEDNAQMLTPFSYVTVRFGMDGAWVGANYGDSYFVLTVDPGVHHLCTSVQSSNYLLKKSIDMATFTAEPGKIYYFAAQLAVSSIQRGGSRGSSAGVFTFGVSQLDDDTGKYRVKAWKLATSKTK